MKKKIIGILICMLLIATAVPAVESLKNNAINTTIPRTPLASMAGSWTEGQKLLASDGANDDYFGCSVSRWGDTTLIGASFDDDKGVNAGSAYVFTRNGSNFIEQAKLLASDGAAYDDFGCSVSISGDTALIGANHKSSDKGAAYVFTRSGSSWEQQAKLIASDGANWDLFGGSVCVSGDTALIGAIQYGPGNGAAYVFTRSGSSWTQQAKLTASDGAIFDKFGVSVSVSGDTALVGASWCDSYWGAAYVFTRSGSSWTQQAKLIASDGATGHIFGGSVCVSGDTALVGADQRFVNGSGAAYVFTRSGSSWTQQAKLIASDGATGDRFGVSVSVSGDTALVGASDDDDKGVNAGSAYVFTRSGSSWTQQAKLIASDGEAGDRFGGSVFLSGYTAFIGAPEWHSYQGKVYMFKNKIPPNPPNIRGPESGKPKQLYSYEFNTTDPNGDWVYYFIDWGDNTTTGWLGPVYSEQTIGASKSWMTRGIYVIKIKAKDSDGLESDWGTLSVTMPFSYEPPHHTFLFWLLERFPNAFPILRQLMGF